MNLIKIILASFILIFCSSQVLYADSHDAQDNNQTTTSEKTSIANNEDEEEDVPLNDPFAGGQGTTAAGENLSIDVTEEKDNEMSLYNFKLVGVISGNLDSYVSLVNATGEIVTLQLFENLNEDTRLVDMSFTEAVFQKNDGKYLIINFKNQILEKDDYVQY